VCRPMLAAFGYATAPPRRSARTVALAVRARDLMVTGTRDVRAGLSPPTREF
jgi:hypothetical protein